MRHGNLFVISGPSGAGKGTLVAQVLKRVPDAWLSISMTTRAPRGAERDGIDYYFASETEFDTLIAYNGLLEWAQVHGKRYGTPRTTVEEQINLGKQVILEIDVQGAFQIKKQMPLAHLIFVEPPSMESLETRLRKRGTESEDKIIQRLKTAELELEQKMEYDIRLVNDDLEIASDELVAYINKKAETC